MPSPRLLVSLLLALVLLVPGAASAIGDNQRGANGFRRPTATSLSPGLRRGPTARPVVRGVLRRNATGVLRTRPAVATSTASQPTASATTDAVPQQQQQQQATPPTSAAGDTAATSAAQTATAPVARGGVAQVRSLAQQPFRRETLINGQRYSFNAATRQLGPRAIELSHISIYPVDRDDGRGLWDPREVGTRAMLAALRPMLRELYDHGVDHIEIEFTRVTTGYQGNDGTRRNAFDLARMFAPRDNRPAATAPSTAAPPAR